LDRHPHKLFIVLLFVHFFTALKNPGQAGV